MSVGASDLLDARPEFRGSKIMTNICHNQILQLCNLKFLCEAIEFDFASYLLTSLRGANRLETRDLPSVEPFVDESKCIGINFFEVVECLKCVTLQLSSKIRGFAEEKVFVVMESSSFWPKHEVEHFHSVLPV